MSPSIKSGLGFVENEKEESSSQSCASNHKDIKVYPEKPDKEVNSQLIQQQKKEIFQRKSFSLNYRSNNHMNVECFICHNFGHLAANCRSILF